MEQKNMIKVLVIEPQKKPYVKCIENTLKSLQNEVGGCIQAVYPWEDEVAIVADDEAKLKDKSLNRALLDEDGRVYDIIAGTFLIVGLAEESFCSLTDELAEKFANLFENPEMFLVGKSHGKKSTPKATKD